MPEPTSPTLNGKTVLITGASRGIGRALAVGFAAAGASVACAARSEALLRELAAEIEQMGGSALAVPADVTSEPAVQRMTERVVAHFGGLDILIVNAGGNLDAATVERSGTVNWQRTIDLNLTAAYFCAKAAIPYLRASGEGKILTIGSGLGHKGMVGRSAYACAKAGLWMLTRVLAQELAADGISVNEIIPGPVDTGSLSEEFRRRVLEPQGEWLKRPEDVVPLALFVASQRAEGPTAQSFSLMRRDG